MALFEIRHLTFTYPGCGAPALKDLDFTVGEGEFLVVCGKSGCGKSTLLRHFKTAMSPYGRRGGEILFDGRELEKVSVREQGARIGYVLQSPDNQIVTDKVWHELAFGLENLGYETGTIRLRVAEMASFFGIQTWFSKKVDELSGGQKQLLNLAAVMAMQPDILVLDEPTSQLDPLAAGDFLATLRKINAELGTAIILIEHRLEEALACADRVLVMEGGGILALAPPRELAGFIKDNDMFQAMPVPMRIFGEAGGTGECPVTVREGREWLERQPKPEPSPAGRDSQYTGPSGCLGHSGSPGISITGAAVEGCKGAGIPSPVIIEAKDVWFRYEKDGPDVVRDLNFQVKKGELYCLLGGNGTGKTTTLNLVGRIYKPYRGKITIKGKELGKYKESELYGPLLGILPQNPQCLFVKDTVEKDLWEMTGKKAGRADMGSKRDGDKKGGGNGKRSGEREDGGTGKGDRDSVRARLEEVIEQTEIGHLLQSHPYDLSGGEQQRAALAKVLLLDPEVILLDEPTKGMDGFYKRKLAGILRGLLAEGRTILMVSHDIEFCAEFGDTCAMFFYGGVAAQKPAREFFMGNSFYTTAANRMARRWCPEAITAKDVIERCR